MDSYNYNVSDLLWFDVSSIETLDKKNGRYYYKKIAIEFYVLEQNKQIYEILTSWLFAKNKKLERENFRVIYRILNTIFEEDPFEYELAYKTVTRDFNENDFDKSVVNRTVKDIQKIIKQIHRDTPFLLEILMKEEMAQIEKINQLIQQANEGAENDINVTLNPLLTKLLLKQLNQHMNSNIAYSPNNLTEYNQAKFNILNYLNTIK